MKVGIVGYGNLGKAIEKTIKENSDFELVAIFSRRKIDGTLPFSKIKDFAGVIDTLFVCVGSKTDLMQTSLKLIKDFNIVDTFDNHNQIPSYFERIDKLAKKHKKVAICSVGWDPGLFSLMRALFDSLGFASTTFWGKGVSQGHTQAIKNIKGVIDGIEFTIPNKKKKRAIKKGKEIIIDKSLHSRLCYVVAKKEDRLRIKNEIINMPDYFLGYKTKVKFISSKRLNKIKNFKHAGEVLTYNNMINFSLNLPSNPEFTAKIAVNYAKSISKLQFFQQFGAFSILDLPISYILSKNKFEFI